MFRSLNQRRPEVRQQLHICYWQWILWHKWQMLLFLLLANGPQKHLFLEVPSVERAALPAVPSPFPWAVLHPVANLYTGVQLPGLGLWFEMTEGPQLPLSPPEASVAITSEFHLPIISVLLPTLLPGHCSPYQSSISLQHLNLYHEVGFQGSWISHYC